YVAQWWMWWRSIQPAERALLGPGMLSTPNDAEWGGLTRLHGKNGLLHVMGTLLWWGDVVALDEEYRNEWVGAVEDVSWVLGELV
ncbi:hypothetical protein DFH07DRAFT_715199, partial [Mycena maculata]